MFRGSLVALALLAFLGLLVLWLSGKPNQETLHVAATTPIVSPRDSGSAQAVQPTYSSIPAPVRTESARAEIDNDCSPKEPLILTDESAEEYKARTLALSDVLAESADADYLLAAALLSQFGESDRPLQLLPTGSFTADQNGNLRTQSGLFLLGWPADASAFIESVVVHVARFVSIGQEPSPRADSTRNSMPRNMQR